MLDKPTLTPKDSTRKKCAYLTHHRGMKELHYLLGKFVTQKGESILDDPRYQELVSYEDMRLWELIMLPGAEVSTSSKHLMPLIEQIRDIHACDQDCST